MIFVERLEERDGRQTAGIDSGARIQYTPGVKFTRYFGHVRKRPDRQGVRDEWIERVMRKPDAESVQADGRVRLWGKVPEAGGKYLRVVLLEDRETVHNAFFDRRFRETK